MVFLRSFLLIFIFIAAAYAEDKQDFIRLTKDAAGNLLSFDTAIVSYIKDDLHLDLISVVHIGEESYYKKLKQKFTEYDALLYELIADPEEIVLTDRTEDNSSILSSIQQSLKSILGLEFQLDQIDYSAENFVHADMTPEDFRLSMREKNESIWSILLKLLLHSSELTQNKAHIAPEIFVLQMLLSTDRRMTLRRIMAQQFQDTDSFIAVFEGTQGSTIISGRNKVALEVLKAQIAAGKKKLAIFYGAGHMPDFEKRLLQEFGFKRDSVEWLVAWNLR